MNRGDGGVNGVIASVKHTGTWFLVSLLQKLGQGSIVPWAHSFEVGGGLPINWLHVHVPDYEDEEDEPRRYLEAALIDAFVVSGRYAVVIPVRDPVRSLITYRIRCGGGSLLHHARRFGTLARWWEELRHVHWFPVDLGGFSDRAASISVLARYVKHATNPEKFVELASSWEPENVTPPDGSGLREAYAAEDLDVIEEEFADELALLRSDERLLRFYGALGYRLPWVTVTV